MSPAFRTAFYAGLAAPASLFGYTPGYSVYVVIPGPAEAFAAVGALVTGAVPASKTR